MWVLGIELRLSYLHGSILPTEASLQPLIWLLCVWGAYVFGGQSTTLDVPLHPPLFPETAHSLSWGSLTRLGWLASKLQVSSHYLSTSLALDYKILYGWWRLNSYFCGRRFTNWAVSPAPGGSVLPPNNTGWSWTYSLAHLALNLRPPPSSASWVSGITGLCHQPQQ